MVSLFDPLAARSTEAEWLDDTALNGAGLRRSMRELALLNRYLGGHASVTQGLQRALPWLRDTRLRIVDVGCGSGDGLRAVWAWAQSRGLDVELIGIDANKDVLDYARTHDPAGHISYQVGDAFGTTLAELKPDVVIASQFCHHFSLTHLAEWVPRLLRASRVVLFSDLHRHPIAHAGFRALARALRTTEMTRHDGAVSIRRGFTRSELEALIRPLPVRHASIRWCFAFRFEVLLVSIDD